MKIIEKIFLLLFFIVVVGQYYGYTKTIEFSFYDEWLWVSRSYFYELLIKGDYKAEAWSRIESYDQPKLAELLYGAWLYPRYLRSEDGKNGFGYGKWLSKNGLGYTVYYNDDYDEFNKSNKVSYVLDWNDGLVLGDMIAKYGNGIEPTLNVLRYARYLNVILLAINFLIIWRIGKELMRGIVPPLMLSLLVSNNSLLTEAGLKAQSDGLFVTLFNFCLLMLILYIRKNKLRYWWFFCFAAGLLISTKLNGIMALIIGGLTLGYQLLIKRKFYWKDMIIKFISMLAIPFTLLVLINPFTWSRPIGNSMFLFEHRAKTAVDQCLELPGNCIFTHFDRLNRILENFYSVENVHFFNYPFGWPVLSMNIYLCLTIILGIFFIMGVIYCLADTKKRKSVNWLMVSSLSVVLISMVFYLKLDWYRYYIQLVLFVVYFQICGVIFVCNLLLGRTGKSFEGS